MKDDIYNLHVILRLLDIIDILKWSFDTNIVPVISRGEGIQAYGGQMQGWGRYKL